MSGRPAAVAVLGLGEAGGRLAADLIALGLQVSGWDPAPERTVGGARRASSPLEAIETADVVLSVNAERAAVSAARAIGHALDATTLYADLNTASASVKRAVAAEIAPSGAAFADVALLAPVPARGIRTPCLASGPGAERFAELFAPLGMPVTTLGDEPGEAATRKLLRSVFTKGIAAAALESLAAGSAAGCEDWVREEIVAIMAAADAALVERFVEGSRLHAHRRVDEMDAAAELLVELGIEPHVTRAAGDVLRGLEAG